MKEILEAAGGYLEKHGVENPRLNAQYLLAHLLGKKNRIDLYMEFDRPLGESELAPMRELMKRRGEGEPLQHLLGTVEFHGRTFLSDRRALVPRPETELLAELILKDSARPARILDMGTGSGVLALTLAAEWPEATVEAADLSPEALALAAENAARLGLAGRVQFHQSDLFSAVPGPFDLIAANLPYVAAEEMAGLSREVQRDPRLALEGGATGTELIRRFVEEARAHLAPGGGLALEIGAGQAGPLMEHLRHLGYNRVRSAADYAGLDRFLFANHP